FRLSDGFVFVVIIPTLQNAQTSRPARPQARNNRKRSIPTRPTPSCRNSSFPGWGTLRISMSRERSWGSFSSSSLHVSVFSQQLHPTPFILRAARSLRHRGMPQLVDNVVHGLRRGSDRHRAGRTTKTAIAGPIPLVEIEIHEGNVLELDVFPNIDLRPIQQRVDSDVCAWREGRLELIPEFRRLIAEIPITMFVTRREVSFLGSRPFLICAHTENDAGIAFLLDQLLESIGFQGRTAVNTTQRMIHPGCKRFFVLPHDQFDAPLSSHSVSIFDHGGNLVARVDMQKRERHM